MFNRKTSLVVCMLVVCLALPMISSAEVKREIWNGAVGSPYMDNAIARVESGLEPDQVDILEEPTWADIADNYVARMTGWLTVPETGEYTLYLSGDDYQRLWVSQDDNPGNAEVVAYVDGWTQSQQWDKYESQKAAPMMLTEGQVLAFVGIMEERGGGDGQDWGWIAPGSEEIVVIPGELFVAEYEVTAPLKAKNPSPANGATGVIDVVATWDAPEGTTSDVYGGTDPEAMDLLAEGLAEAMLPVGTAGVDLDLETTYYWQVISSNGGESAIWSFTTEDAAFPVEGIIATTDATSTPDGGTAQQTVDGSGLDENDGHSTQSMEMWLGKPAEGEPVSITYEFPRVYKMAEMLVWNSNTGFEGFLGYGFKDVTVETSVDGETWTVLADVEFAQAPGADAYAANTTVDMMGVAAKFVKLTANTNWGGAFPDAGLAEVRFMYIPAQARIVAPADGATGLAPDAELDWYGGRGSESSDVYINDELVDTVTESMYAPVGLELGSTYTWKIDENDGVDIWEGDVWSFSTVASIAVSSLAGESVDYNNGVEPFLTEISEMLDPAVDLSAYGAQALQVAYNVAPMNVAMAGSVTASTTGYGWTPDRVIDGDPGTGSHSADNDPDKWLEIELDDVYTLDTIIVLNRGNCCGERIATVVVKTLDADRNETYVSEPVAAEDAFTGSVHTYTNDGAGFADVKFIRLEGGTDFLQIMEVQALPTGYPVPTYVAVEDSAGQSAVLPAEVAGAGTQTMTAAIDYLAAAGVDVTDVAKIAVGVGDPINPAAGGSGTLSISNVTVGVPGPVFSEDFEGLPLGPNVDEELAGDAVWTKTAPAGWTIDDTGMAGVGDPATDGVTEWAGWSFADKAWWTEAAGDQDRSMFDLGTGTVAIADPDEWDDDDHAEGYFNSFLATPAIDVSGVMTSTLQLTFASSWRPEFDSYYQQTGNITVSFDGGDPVEVLLWESDEASENYKPYATNEMVTVEIEKPDGAQSMVLTFGCFDAGNDWWWAIDNIEIGL